MHLSRLSFKAGRWSEPFPTAAGADTLVIAFGAASFMDDPAPLRELETALPGSILLGCSTAGEVHADRVEDGTLAVAVATFEHTRLKRAGSEVKGAEGSREAGASLARILDAPDLKAVLVLSDGLKVNGSDLVRGFNDLFRGRVVVTGGLAGDGDRFQRTWVLKDGEPVTGWVEAVGLYGDAIRVSHASKGGWDTFGPERRITRASGNVLFEVDGKPALELYKTYLGDRASGLPATALLFPLALREKAGEDRHLVRTVLAVDEHVQSLTFAGDVPEGSLVQLMRANSERLILGAEQAATGLDTLDGRPTLAIAISCVGRRLVLGERAEEEVEATLQALPPGTEQVGFYSYGEISPYATGACDLHNQTMTLTVLQEA